MGICLSRRAMQADAEAEAEAEAAGASSKFRNRHGKAAGTEVDMINPARLLLESPRISTNEMGMLGMFFQKKYCKPLQHHHQQPQHGYEKLMDKKNKAECELGLEAEMASSKGATMMTANVLFEKDEYPTFEPNSRAAGGQAAESVVAVAAGRVENEEDARRSKDSNAVNEGGGGGCSRGEQMWASAGEDFFSDWEDRSERGSSGIRASSVAGGAPEIGVFEAEQYFKEEPRASDGSCFYDASNNNNNDDAESSISEALLKQPADASRSSSELRPSSSAAKSPSGGGGGGVGSGSWVSSCAAASAVKIDRGEAFHDHGRTLRRAKSKAELQLSKMFKLLGSSSSSTSQAKHKPRNSIATTTTATTGKRQQQQKSNENAKPSKSTKIRESHVKDWMDKARKSSDGIFALGQEDCGQKSSSSNNEQHADLNLLPANAAHHQPLTPEHSATTGRQPVGFTFSGSTTDSSAAGALNESTTSTRNQGFGSPFPASPNSDQKQQQPEEPRIVVSAVASSSSSSRDRLPARPRPRPRAKTTTRSIIQHEEEVEGGNESDSSSDLFELDSVTTSLSSARSSLSRLSSARSSIRKSTADEQDLLHLQFCSDNKAVLAATLRANVLESASTTPAAARAALACNVAAEDAAPAENAPKDQDFLRERVSSISLTDSQTVTGSRGSAAAAVAAGGITANEENKPPPPPTSRRGKSEILLSRHSLNARSVAPWNNSNGVLAVQT